jgi:hypothetical protein
MASSLRRKERKCLTHSVLFLSFSSFSYRLAFSRGEVKREIAELEALLAGATQVTPTSSTYFFLILSPYLF